MPATASVIAAAQATVARPRAAGAGAEGEPCEPFRRSTAVCGSGAVAVLVAPIGDRSHHQPRDREQREQEPQQVLAPLAHGLHRGRGNGGGVAGVASIPIFLIGAATRSLRRPEVTRRRDGLEPGGVRAALARSFAATDGRSGVFPRRRSSVALGPLVVGSVSTYWSEAEKSCGDSAAAATGKARKTATRAATIVRTAGMLSPPASAGASRPSSQRSSCRAIGTSSRCSSCPIPPGRQVRCCRAGRVPGPSP